MSILRPIKVLIGNQHFRNHEFSRRSFSEGGPMVTTENSEDRTAEACMPSSLKLRKLNPFLPGCSN